MPKCHWTPPVLSFSLTAREELAPMEFSFVAYCTKSMCPLLFLRQGAWISTFFCLCACVFPSVTLFSLTFLHFLPFQNHNVSWHCFITLSTSTLFFMSNYILSLSSSSSVPPLSSLQISGTGTECPSCTLCMGWPTSELWPVWIHCSCGNSEQFRACGRNWGRS